MNDVALTSVGEEERRKALATLIEFHKLWLAERMPDDGRNSVFLGQERIDYERLKGNLDDQRKYFIAPAPYPGLRSFTPQEARVFFGRASDVEEVQARLDAHRMVMVLGGSGSGKSSLVRAGVLPYLNSDGRIKGRGGAWYWCEFRPELSPVANLARALSTNVVIPLMEVIRRRAERGSPPPSDALAELGLSLEHDTEALHAWVSAPFNSTATPEQLVAALWDFVDVRLDRLDKLAGGGLRADKPSLLVLLDQFEEVFRDPVNEGQKSQNAALLSLLDQLDRKLRGPYANGGLFMVITMRSEELHRCGEFDGLTDIVNRSVFLLELLDPKREMDRAVLRSAIVEPAQSVFVSYGIPLEDGNPDSPFAPGVVDWLIQHSQKHLAHRPDQLPLLQHALRSMWDHAVLRWADPDFQGVPRIEEVDLPGDDKDTPYPDFDLCLSYRANAAAAEARGRFVDFQSDDKPKPLSAEAAPAGEAALRAAMSALSVLDDRKRRARRFATRDEIVCHLRNLSVTKDLDDLPERLERALSALIFHGYLVGGGKDRPYDISHEALIRNWDRCSEWLDENEYAIEGISEILTTVDPAEFWALKDNSDIAGSVSGIVRAKVATIGDDQMIPDAWAIDQLQQLLQAHPERRRVWSGGGPDHGPPSREEAASILDEMRRVVLAARAAREDIRLTDALAEQRRQANIELEKAAREALAARAEALASEQEARAAEAQAQVSERNALASERTAKKQVVWLVGLGALFLVALLFSLYFLVEAAALEKISERTLAMTQVKTPLASTWSQAMKLGVLEKSIPPSNILGFGKVPRQAVVAEELWDNLARSQIGANFWLVPDKMAPLPNSTHCWTRAAGDWKGEREARLTDFPSRGRSLTVASVGDQLQLRVQENGSPGSAASPIPIFDNSAVPPLSEGTQVCVSNDASILTVALRGSPVPNVYEINIVNCPGCASSFVRPIDPSIAPSPPRSTREDGALPDVQFTSSVGDARVAQIDGGGREGLTRIAFAPSWAEGGAPQQSYVAAFRRGWVGPQRVKDEGWEQTCASAPAGQQSDPGDVAWSCRQPDGKRVIVTMKPLSDTRAPGASQAMRKMLVQMKASRGRKLEGGQITLWTPLDVAPVSIIGNRLLLRDSAGDAWAANVAENELQDIVRRDGDSANLPGDVSRLAPTLRPSKVDAASRRGSHP